MPEPSKMTANSKITMSKRVIVLSLVALLALSAFNIYLFLENGSAGSGTVGYDYIVSQNGSYYQSENARTGSVSSLSGNASSVINSALAEGNSVYLNSGTYILDADVLVSNKIHAEIVGNGATIIGNGHKIVVSGDEYNDSEYVNISGLTIINGTIRIENSFGTTISNMIIENTSTGIELANTKSWSENTVIEASHFVNATEGIVFRTPIGNATGSYASSQISRCFFNLRDNSVAIKVEPLAEFSDSQMQDVRVWTGEDGHTNQTGLLLEGTMYQSLLTGVVFESFTDVPNNMFAIDIGQSANTAPIMDGGVSFLGNWTAMIHNPYSVWVSGVGSAFERQDISIPVGVNGQYGDNKTIQTLPLKIFTFQPKITVSGTLANNEVISVRIRLEFVDNVMSNSVVKTFNSTGSVWLSDDDMLQLYPSQNVIWAVVVDAQSSSGSTNAVVTVSGYGTAG